jgi:SAM-dependent methyltransferase
VANETTIDVAQFYQQAPFPNYAEFQTKTDLTDVIERNQFLKDLKATIGFGSTFLEVGSGTNNQVVAFDPTLESLVLGQDFATNNKITNVTFLNADLFDNPLKKNSFDYVWCSGVLHHTESSEKGFDIISNWLKPEGLMILGLYNKYGRLRTNLRQIIYKLSFKSHFGKKLFI